MTLPLPPILLTDVKYRASLAAVQALGKAGYPVYTAQTEAELQGTPPAFSSVYAKGVFLVPGSCYDVEYPARLAEICNSIRAEKEQVPVLFPIGAATLSQVAGHSEELASTARFLISPPEVLDRANDKRAVAELAQTLNIPIPEEFDCREDRLPPRFPVVVKPRCGESSACTQKNVIVRYTRNPTLPQPIPKWPGLIRNRWCRSCLQGTASVFQPSWIKTAGRSPSFATAESGNIPSRADLPLAAKAFGTAHWSGMR